MAETFRRVWKINTDQVTEPDVNATELREAMKLVYDNFQLDIDPANDELVAALGILRKAAENGNWVMYVP